MFNNAKILSWQNWMDVLCCILVICGTLYAPIIYTIGLGLMIIRILFIGSWKNKIQNFKQQKIILLCLLSVYILNIVGLIWTQNIAYGLRELNHKMPFLIIPIYMVAAYPIQKNTRNIIFSIYIILITIGIIIGVINYAIDPYADTRLLIPSARNIAFGLNISLAVAFLCILTYKNELSKKISIPIIVIFVSFLFIASLISGIISLCILTIIGSLAIMARKNKKSASIAFGIVVLSVIASSVWLKMQYNDYFVPKESKQMPINETTALGNTYTSTITNFIENGFYVDKYSCPTEVEQAWKNRTGEDLNTTCNAQSPSSYTYASVIYRYLNSKGLKKDASGVKALSDKDIENIKHGVANIVYTEKFSLRPRLYQTFYEFERYFRTGEVHQMSIIQRLFWSNNALQIIKANILIGTGTGDTRDALVSPVIDSHPELCTTGCNPHNQFLYSLAAFGLLGLAALIFFMLYAPLRLHLFKNPEFCAFFIVALCWMFAESSFMSYEGMTFASLFMSYFCLNTSKLK